MVIAIVAIVVVGPKDLPKLLRTVGKTISGVKRMAGDFQQQFNDAIEETDLGDLKNLATGKPYNPLDSIKDAAKDVENDFMSGLDEESTGLFPENETSKRLAKADAKSEVTVDDGTVKTVSKSGKKTTKKTTKPASKKVISKKTATKKVAASKASKPKTKSKANQTTKPATKSVTKPATKSAVKRAAKSVKT